MFGIFSKNIGNGKKYKFYLSYGFPLGIRKSNNPPFLQKAICPEIKAELYKIGYVAGDCWPTGELYVLVQEAKVIPFLVLPPVIITQKNSQAVVTIQNREILAAEYKVPVASITVINVGKDLKNYPRNRDQYASYEQDVFCNKEKHSYEFSDVAEYQQAINLINSALPVLLYDRYDHSSYSPIIPAEINHGVGPWNFEENLYQKEMSAAKGHYGSQYRKVYSIEYELNKAQNAEKRNSRIDSRHASRELQNLFDKVNAHMAAMQSKTEETVGGWIAEFERNVKTSKDFINFLESHPVPRPYTGVVRISDVQQDEEDRNAFFEYLASSNHPAIQKFFDYKRDLEQEALIEADKCLADVKQNTFSSPDIHHFLTNCLNNEEKNILIEDLMLDLIQRETSYHSVNKWGHGSNFQTYTLKRPEFLKLIKKLYDYCYKDVVPSYEHLLVIITETMVRRVSMRKAREQTESVRHG